MKYLYPYECEKRGLSSPGELQAAIDSNRREGRRQSYSSAVFSYSPVGTPSVLSSPKIQMSHMAMGSPNVSHLAHAISIKKGTESDSPYPGLSRHSLWPDEGQRRMFLCSFKILPHAEWVKVTSQITTDWKKICITSVSCCLMVLRRIHIFISYSSSVTSRCPEGAHIFMRTDFFF